MDELSYTIIINLIKISLLCLFLRIFPNRKFRIICSAMIVFLAGVAVMWALLLTFQCQPVSTNWNINIPHSKCHNVQIYAYIGAASSMCEDIIIMILPIPFLLQLQISTRKKMGVLFIFSLGILQVSPAQSQDQRLTNSVLSSYLPSEFAPFTYLVYLVTLLGTMSILRSGQHLR